jgi:hypothetical protein
VLGFCAVSEAPVSALPVVVQPAPPPPPPPAPAPLPPASIAGFGGAPPPYAQFAPTIPGPNDNTYGISGVDAFQRQLDDFYSDWEALNRKKKKKRKQRQDEVRKQLKAAWRQRQEEEAEELLVLLGIDLLMLEEDSWIGN